MTDTVLRRNVESLSDVKIDDLVDHEVGLSGSSLLLEIDEVEVINGRLVATAFEVVGIVLDDAAVTQIDGVPVRAGTLIRRTPDGHEVVSPGYPVDHDSPQD